VEKKALVTCYKTDLKCPDVET